ncbi:hypothetical protein SAMN05192549_107277 [Duganella sacchari]|jgi:hypothetical protein|uniref:Uncharacterized protein n=1 Tax=Duganella sacchari TaxID=551987 RepID=A0A1M7QMP1_9BURK|nr:hypothetical protein [Duganella sacchari]SHN32351.1 hypothetical protein SAMN05192549_107277 [Duganella sacchari]
MNDKLINTTRITTQLEFDDHGGFKLVEVLDQEVLEAIGGGDIVIPTPKLPNAQVLCSTKNECPTNYCDPKPEPKQDPKPKPDPKPDPSKEKSKAADEDGDEG